MFLAIVIAAVVSVAFIGSLVDALRDPARYARVYDERLWRRIHVWVWAITLAVLAGAMLGGARGETLGVVAVVGLVAGSICWRFETTATRLPQLVGIRA